MNLNGYVRDAFQRGKVDGIDLTMFNPSETCRFYAQLSTKYANAAWRNERQGFYSINRFEKAETCLSRLPSGSPDAIKIREKLDRFYLRSALREYKKTGHPDCILRWLNGIKTEEIKKIAGKKINPNDMYAAAAINQGIQMMHSVHPPSPDLVKYFDEFYTKIKNKNVPMLTNFAYGCITSDPRYEEWPVFLDTASRLFRECKSLGAGDDFFVRNAQKLYNMGFVKLAENVRANVSNKNILRGTFTDKFYIKLAEGFLKKGWHDKAQVMLQRVEGGRGETDPYIINAAKKLCAVDDKNRPVKNDILFARKLLKEKLLHPKDGEGLLDGEKCFGIAMKYLRQTIKKRRKNNLIGEIVHYWDPKYYLDNVLELPPKLEKTRRMIEFNTNAIDGLLELIEPDSISPLGKRRDIKTILRSIESDGLRAMNLHTRGRELLTKIGKSGKKTQDAKMAGIKLRYDLS